MSEAPSYRPRLRLTAIALATVLVTVLSGCTSESASDLPMPDVVWDNGEPTGDLWDSPWARAYVEGSIRLNLAYLYGDYSDAELVSTVGYDRAVNEAQVEAKTRFSGLPLEKLYLDLSSQYAFYGTILAIDEAADQGSARVQACVLGTRGGEPVPMSVDWIITKDAEGRFVTDREAGTRLEGGCSEAETIIARWAEPIDLESITRDTVKMPLPRDYYVDLGVISE